MSRTIVTTESEALAEIDAGRAKPNWRERRHILPFQELSGDEFEVFCFLLLKREHPQEEIRYYGKTGDGGRDIIHRRITPNGLAVRLIQCKRYESNVGAPVIRKDMAKVWVNVFDGTIPDRPDEVVFYVVPDLTNPAKNLIDSQDRWRQEAATAIKDHLKTPVPEELARHGTEWWPNPTSEAALSLTERARKHTDLIEEFFGVRKVIDGSVGDVTNAVCEKLLPPIAKLTEHLSCETQAIVVPPQSGPAAVDNLIASFARSSTGLLRWPTTVSDDHWLERPELQVLLDRVSPDRGSVTIVLGPPGCGKSALLARFGQQLVGQGTCVLAIKADQLWNAVDSAAKLAERLDLPVLTDQAVLAVAQVGLVVVLLDQLDALADLVDLRSERLHVLLNLIDKLAGHAHIHVVCSCREFEYRHDGRLSRLDAHAVRLQPPAWEQVSEVLAAQSVRTDGWPVDSKLLLQTPHHLALFLNLLRGSGEHPVFTTYQQLFINLWQEHVVRPGGGRSNLLHDLASQLAEQEELWIDRARFEDRWATVEALIAADVLCLTEDRFRFGFRHQSLFEFTRARAFAREGASLAAYVLARQDALFVRPTLWMTLNYLRRVNLAVYSREFDALWNQVDLRRHVKHLLIDFLSQVEEPPPVDWEQSRMIAVLHDASWRRKALTAVTRQPVWFRLLAASHLSAEMRKAPEEAHDVVWVLVAAFGFDRDLCLQLMEDNWLPDDSKLSLVWRTLTYLEDWNKQAAELAIAVILRTAVDQGGMWHLAQTIATSDPSHAVRLVAIWLDAARRRIVSGGGDGVADPMNQLRQLVDSHNRWHGIEKLAEQVPVEFARKLWPVVRDIATHLRASPSDYVIRYADDRLSFSRLDRREYVKLESPDHFFLAFDAAMREFARTRSREFLAFLEKAGNPDSMLLQRLMCRGVRELVPSYPAASLAFLTADVRRFWLGGMHDDQGDSVDLITALGSSLTGDQMPHLLAAIRGWEMYRYREGEERDRGCVYARGHRFRLLTALPSDRLPDDLRREIDAERAALPAYVRTARTQSGTEMRLIGSPVSHAELTNRTDSEIVGLFEDLPDSTEWHHPKDWMVGGSIQLSREFEEFAKAHPDRARVIVAGLSPRVQERPVAHAVRGFVAAKRPTHEIISFVQQLDARGFAGQEFRETVASALDELAQADGLPEFACDLLQVWRLADWPNNDRDESEWEIAEDSRRPASILWQYDGMVSLPHGRFPVLSALTRGYLCRQPIAAGLWLEMLCDHVEREESLTNWRAMCLYLDSVLFCTDQDRARSFLDRLFARFPGVLTCHLGVRLLGRVAQFLPDKVRQRAYDAVRAWGPERGPQAFGELVCLRHLLHPEDASARGQVESALAEPTDPDIEWVSVGIAFAAVHLWDEPSCRPRATELLCRLIPQPSERISAAAMTDFQTRDELPLDEATLRILRQVDTYPDALMRSNVDESFFDHLLDVFVVDAELVCRISEEAVRRRGMELQSAERASRIATSALIDISLRLQRTGGGYRSRGMKLFEALLDLGAAEAINLARSNDHRLVSGGYPIRLPRRKCSEATSPNSDMPLCSCDC